MRVSAASSVGSGRLRDCTLAGRGGRGAPRLVWEAMTWLEKPQDCTSSVWAQWDEHGQRNQVRVSAASSVGSGRLRDCTLAGRGGRGAPRLVWEAMTWLEKPQDCTSSVWAQWEEHGQRNQVRVSAASSVGSGRLRDCTLAGRGGRGAPRLVWEAKTWLEKPQDCTSSVWAQWDEHGQRNQVRVSAASSVGSGRLRDCTLAGRGGRGAPRLVWEAMTWLEKPQDCTSSVWAQWDEHGQRNQVRVSAASSVGSGRLRDCTLAGRGGRGAPRLVWEAMTWLEKPQDCTSSVWAQWDEHGQRNQVRVSAASSVGSGRLRDCTLAARGGRGAQGWCGRP